MIIVPAFILVSCAGGSANHSNVTGDTVVFKYASLLEMVDYENYIVAKVADPWHKGKTLHTYVLLKQGIEEPASLPEGTVVRVPVTRAIPFTTVHSSLIMALGRQSSIVGVADLRYIKIPYVKRECAAGRISDVGGAMSPNIEKILDTRPDVLLVSPFENSGGYGKLDEIGVPMIECAEYMEPSALGRAEWTRFYGILFGAERQADSLFAVVDSTYHALKTVAATTTVRVTAAMDKMTGSVWYVPGGKSTLGTMISDAGISYPLSDDTHAGSLSLPFETVLEKFGDADIWMFRYRGEQPATYEALLSEHRGYAQFKAFRQQRCYGCNVEKSSFYEETPFRPDLLLGDYIRIAHPELGLPGELRYFEKVK